jgi:hypothetical protein
MAIPTGSGSEVLDRKGGNQASGTATLFTVPTLHIYTILSMTFHRDGSGNQSGVLVEIHDGTTLVDIFKQAVGGLETFVWNDKLVLRPADYLKMTLTDSADIKWYMSYIDQDWT